jgi:peptidoglycan hydrolase-like protein with peptidoglycan-binding domain
VKKGQTGNSVKWVQWELCESGYQVTIDGDYGKNTLSAVKEFQKAKKLSVDGIVGKNTRTALQKAH